MTKTIAELYNGNLQPIRYLGLGNNEIKQLENLMEQILEEFQKGLSEKQEVLFKKYDDCINEYLLALSEQAFCDGFSVGAKILAEALFKAEQVI